MAVAYGFGGGRRRFCLWNIVAFSGIAAWHGQITFRTNVGSPASWLAGGTMGMAPYGIPRDSSDFPGRFPSRECLAEARADFSLPFDSLAREQDDRLGTAQSDSFEQGAPPNRTLRRCRQILWAIANCAGLHVWLPVVLLSHPWLATGDLEVHDLEERHRHLWESCAARTELTSHPQLVLMFSSTCLAGDCLTAPGCLLRPKPNRIGLAQNITAGIVYPVEGRPIPREVAAGCPWSQGITPGQCRAVSRGP
jgi:hypothetical protein